MVSSVKGNASSLLFWQVKKKVKALSFGLIMYFHDASEDVTNDWSNKENL